MINTQNAQDCKSSCYLDILIMLLKRGNYQQPGFEPTCGQTDTSEIAVFIRLFRPYNTCWTELTEGSSLISEEICLAVVKALNGRVSTYTTQTHLDTPEGPKTTKQDVANALAEGPLIRPLLARYDLADLEAAIRWLQLGEYISRTQWGLAGLWVHVLTEKGVAAANSGAFTGDERKLLYQDSPYQVFLAHQFRGKDASLTTEVVDNVLVPAGYTVVDGRADGLEQFRTAILSKIRSSRFFLCLLSQRSRLDTGLFASSVWLYQEVGAAVALSRRPLLLVEEGIDSHYAGELQKVYEYVPFTRADFAVSFSSIAGRFDADLQRHHIPLPPR